MALSGGVSILSGAYLHHTQPKKPQIFSEYENLNQKYNYLNSTKQFNLEKAADKIYLQKQVDKVTSLSEKIKRIELSDDYVKITKHKDRKSKHNKYWSIPILSFAIGVSSMLYGMRLDSKINPPL